MSGSAAGVDALADMLGAGMRLGGAGGGAGGAATGTMAAFKERAALDAARRNVDKLQGDLRHHKANKYFFMTQMTDGINKASCIYCEICDGWLRPSLGTGFHKAYHVHVYPLVDCPVHAVCALILTK